MQNETKSLAKDYLSNPTTIKPLTWNEDKELVEVIDQRLLPAEFKIIEITSSEEMAFAIKDMIIRGAPLIGVGAAFGMALAAKSGEDFCEADKLLRGTRPTAVNLHWALDQIQEVLKSCELDDRETIYKKILAKAKWILEDDIERCFRMSEHAANYIKENIFNRLLEKLPDARLARNVKAELTPSSMMTSHDERNAADGTLQLVARKLKIITHCNAGALATGGYGTALGVIRTLAAENLIEIVYVDETRPRQQGARLTAWELAHDGIPATLVTDNMAAHIMKVHDVDCVIVGSDRITANGDAANKIGTYGLAIIAKHHNVPFFVIAPESTVDRSLSHGDLIPIEERHHEEVSHINGKSCTAAKGVGFFNPGFDVTPHELIEKIFTENGAFN